MLGHAILLLSVGTALAGVSVRMPYLGTAGVTYNVPTPDVPFHRFGARISSVAYGNGAFLGRAAYGPYGPAAAAIVPAAPLVAAAPLAVQPAAVSTVHHVPAVAQVPITKLEHQPAVVQSVVDVAKASVATKKFEIRRPAIEKEFYDIEERVIVRPVGKAVVELDQPAAKSQKGPTVIQPAAVRAVSAAPPLAFATHGLPAFATRASLSLPAFARTAHVYSYPFQGPTFLQHHTIAVSSTPSPVHQQESEPELIRPDDPANPQPENPLEPQPQPSPYPPQQSEPQPQPFPAQQPDPQPFPAQQTDPQPFPAQQNDPQPFPPQQDNSDTDSESISIDNPEISSRSQQPQPGSPAPPTQDPQIDEYNNEIARQRSNALEQQLQITRAQTEAQKALLARLQAMSDAQEQLLARSRQELQAQEELLTRAKQQREQEILFRAREQQVQEQQLLTNVRQQQELMARARQQQEQDQQILARARQQQDIQARTALYGERLNFQNQPVRQGLAPSQDERTDSISTEVRSRDSRMRNAAETTATQTLDVIPSTRLSAQESLSNQEKLIDLLTARGGVTEVRNAGEVAPDSSAVRGRVLSVTPAPELSSSSSALNERVNTRRVVVNRRIQTVQNVDIVEPFTKIERVAVHRPALLQTARVGVAHVPTSLPVHTVHHAPSFVAYRH